MKNLICAVVLVLLGMIFGTEPTYAAFPAANSEPAVSVKTEKRSFEEFIDATIEKYNLPAPPYNGEGADNPALSITSLALGIAGVAAVVLSLSFFPMWGLVFAAGAALGIAAIVLGAMGARRRPLRGVGIAGLVLGCISAGTAVIVGFFALLILLILGGWG